MAFRAVRTGIIAHTKQQSPRRERGEVEHPPVPAFLWEGNIPMSPVKGSSAPEYYQSTLDQSPAAPHPTAPPAVTASPVAPPPLFHPSQPTDTGTYPPYAPPTQIPQTGYPAGSALGGPLPGRPLSPTGAPTSAPGDAGPFTSAVPVFKPGPQHYHNGGQAVHYHNGGPAVHYHNGGSATQASYSLGAGAPRRSAYDGDTYVTVREPLLQRAPWDLGQMVEREIRHQFVAKVLSLLTATLVVTGLVALAFRTVPGVQRYVAYNPWTVWLAFSLGLVTIITLSCSDRLRRTYPHNLLSLGVFVLCESVLVGVVTAAVDTDILLLAFAITTAITTSLVLYALRTKTDFTALGGSLFSSLVALLVVLIIGSFFHIPAFDLFVSAAAAVLFSVYIVFDIQMMTGGDHMYSLSVDEYVFATLNLYLDIINLFIYILRLLSVWRMEYS